MSKKEQLYETLGELIYVIAKADGVIQDEEVERLNTILEKHPWASEIKWSFNYERKKDHSVEDVYKKVIDHCHQYGPSPEYEEFIDVMEKIAEASKGIDPQERQVISSFTEDLTERFKRDIEKLYS